jgi:hypothetical protein
LSQLTSIIEMHAGASVNAFHVLQDPVPPTTNAYCGVLCLCRIQFRADIDPGAMMDLQSPYHFTILCLNLKLWVCGLLFI